eukprot:TRINITY_DN9379_c0_g1_i1.p1 TRINITY_DN9379_c0_g1~~TRINITY_DN9379_c0_g1_i1.p1  ORF type:complete len:677 (+),score=160.43 TRINITY_DN9379_c0_g1_i1:128-2158(+)
MEVTQKIRQNFNDLSREFDQSIVFVDEYAAEVIAWSITVGVLLEDFNIKSLHTISKSSDLSQVDLNASKIVFLLGGFIDDSASQIKTILGIENDIEECIIYTAYPEASHTHNLLENPSISSGESEPFRFWTKEFVTVLKKSPPKHKERFMNALVAVVYFPALIAATVLPDVILLPSTSSVFPVLPHRLPQDQRLALENLNHPMQMSMETILSGLLSVCNVLELKEEIWAVGSTGRFIAREWQKIPRNPERQLRPASIILIDRTLDLVECCSHSDNLLDRILTTLDHPQSFSADVRVPIAQIFKDLIPAGTDAFSVMHGSIAHRDANSISIMDVFVGKREKDALNEIRKKLVDILTREKLLKTLPKMGTVTPKQLISLMETFGKDPPIFYKYRELLECIAAVIESLQQSPQTHWDELLSIEKILLLSVEDPSQSMIDRLIQVVRSPIPGTDQRFGIKEVMILTLLIYSLIGDVDTTHEKNLQEAMIDTIMMHPQQDIEWLGDVRHSLKEYFDEVAKDQESKSQEMANGVRREVRDRIDEIFQALHGISSARSSLIDYKTVAKSKAGTTVYIPLAQQIAIHLFEDEKSDLNDITKYGGHSIGNVLTSGFSRFGFGTKAPKPRPTENEIVFLFFIGGITPIEIRDIKERAAKSKNQVLIGSTCLATPNHICQMVLNPSQ